jgi:hypothetical protein
MRFYSVFLLALVSLFFLVGCTTTAPRRATDIDSVRIKEVKPRYMAESDFVRLREYYSGIESTGRRMILRSDPDVRAGYYFTLVLDTRIGKLPRGTRVEANVYTPFANEVQSFEFNLPRERPRTREIFVGLTGEDWPDASLPPSAWQISVVTPRGRVLGTYQSFLWE